MAIWGFGLVGSGPVGVVEVSGCTLLWGLDDFCEVNGDRLGDWVIGCGGGAVVCGHRGGRGLAVWFWILARPGIRIGIVYIHIKIKI